MTHSLVPEQHQVVAQLIGAVRQQLNSIMQDAVCVDLVLAISGGLDSSVLLDIIGQLQLEFTDRLSLCVVHVNHGLSPFADQWQSHVQAQCLRMGLEFCVDQVKLEGSANLEERARHERYRILQQVVQARQALAKKIQRKTTTWLVLGHHSNDVAENFLLRLMRGAGPLGLASMRCLDTHYLGFPIWRPLFEFKKIDITLYLHARRLPFVHDESNNNDYHSRNYIRNQLIPLLEDRWPGAVQSIRMSQTYCQEAAQLSADLAAADFADCGKQLSPANIPALQGELLLALPEYRQKNLIRYWLKQQGVDQFRNTLFLAINSGLQACVQSPSSRQRLKIAVDFKKSLFISFSKQCLYFYREYKQLSQVSIAASDFKSLQALFGIEFLTRSQPVNTLSNWSCTDQGLLSFGLTSDQWSRLEQCNGVWRVARKGEKIQLETKPYPMKITKLWHEWQVPAALRSRWPLLVNQQDQVIYIPGCYSK